MSSLIPPGSRMVLIGSANSIQRLNTFSPLEEGTAEGSLLLMRLDFADFPTDETLAKLEKSLSDAGIPTWPGYGYIVYADTGMPSVYLTWQKGIVWMPIIIGILVTVALPPLLMGLVWWILPQSLKDLISGMVNLGMMALVMFLMFQFMKLLAAPAKSKQVRKPEGAEETRKLEEAKT